MSATQLSATKSLHADIQSLNSSIDALNSTVFFDGFEKWAEKYMLDLEVSFKARVEKAGTKYIDSCIVDVEERLDVL